MAEIIPRWEWRTVGGDVPQADVAFDALRPASVDESDELLLSDEELDELSEVELLSDELLEDDDAEDLPFPERESVL